MVQIKQKWVPESKYNTKCPYTMDAEYITVHNTANDASAANEVNYMTNNNNEVSFHYAVDDIGAIEAIPTNRNAWHAGDGNGPGNRESIGIEICYSECGGELYEKAENNAVELVAQLLQKHGLGIDKVKQHHDWSGKNCPHRIRQEGTWGDFLDRVEAAMGGASESMPPPVQLSGEVVPIPTLKKGSKGGEVKKLQSILGGLAVDGDFGSKTESALKEWQDEYDLTADGIYGSKSQEKMQDMLDGEESASEPDEQPEQTKTTYRVYANGKWYGWITGYNDTNSNGYAGVVGSQIMGVQIQGDVEYRVRTTDGKWWSWIKGYNTTNSNGYAGTLNKPIDAIQIKNKTYRVSPVKSNYLGWITNYNTTDSNGYAGIYGKAIDRLQIK